MLAQQKAQFGIAGASNAFLKDLRQAYLTDLQPSDDRQERRFTLNDFMATALSKDALVFSEFASDNRASASYRSGSAVQARINGDLRALMKRFERESGPVEALELCQQWGRDLVSSAIEAHAVVMRDERGHTVAPELAKNFLTALSEVDPDRPPREISALSKPILLLALGKSEFSPGIADWANISARADLSGSRLDVAIPDWSGSSTRFGERNPSRICFATRDGGL